MSETKAVELVYDVVDPKNSDTNSTIILIHGATGSKETWYKVSKILADKLNMKVYAFDLRNHGDSPRSVDFTVDIMGKDLENFMDQHKIKTSILVGHSLGGLLSMYFSLTKPSRVEKLIIEDATMKPPTDDTHKMLSSFLNFLKSIPAQIPLESDLETAKHIAADLMESSLPEKLRSNTKRRDEFPMPLTKENGVYKWKTNIEALEKSFSSTTLDIKPLINANDVYEKPTLFIHGTRSMIDTMKDKDYHLEFFPQAIFKPIEDATHLVHTEYPDEFCELVINFVLNSPQ